MKICWTTFQSRTRLHPSTDLRATIHSSACPPSSYGRGRRGRPQPAGNQNIDMRKATTRSTQTVRAAVHQRESHPIDPREVTVVTHRPTPLAANALHTAHKTVCVAWLQAGHWISHVRTSRVTEGAIRSIGPHFSLSYASSSPVVWTPTAHA